MCGSCSQREHQNVRTCDICFNKVIRLASGQSEAGREEITLLQARVAQLKEVETKLTKALSEAQESYRVNQTKTSAEHRQRVLTLEGECSQLKGQLKSTQEELEEVENALSTKEEQAKQLKWELAAQQAAFVEAQKSHVLLQNSLAASQTSLSENQSELSATIKIKEAQIESMAQKTADLLALQDTINQEKSEAERVRRLLSDEISKAVLALDERAMELKAAQELNDTLQTKNTSLSSALTECRQQLSEKQEELQKLRHEKDNLHQELGSAKELTQAQNGLNSELEQLRAANEALKQAKTALEQKQQSWEDDVTSLRSQLVTKDSEVRELTERLNLLDTNSAPPGYDALSVDEVEDTNKYNVYESSNGETVVMSMDKTGGSKKYLVEQEDIIKSPMRKPRTFYTATPPMRRGGERRASSPNVAAYSGPTSAFNMLARVTSPSGTPSKSSRPSSELKKNNHSRNSFRTMNAMNSANQKFRSPAMLSPGGILNASRILTPSIKPNQMSFDLPPTPRTPAKKRNSMSSMGENNSMVLNVGEVEVPRTPNKALGQQTPLSNKSTRVKAVSSNVMKKYNTGTFL